MDFFIKTVDYRVSWAKSVERTFNICRVLLGICKIAFILIIASATNNSHALKSYYKKAKIIKTDSTKLDGYVERDSESSLTIKVKFKESVTDKKYQTIYAPQIRQLVFLDDSTVFQNVRYARHKDSAKIVENRLAKKMLSGHAELYKLQLPKNELNIIYELSNTFVYIIKIDTAHYVLDQMEKRVDPSSELFKDHKFRSYNYILYKNYKKVLSSILKNHPKLKRKIRRLRFKDRDIVPLIDSYNAAYKHVPKKVFVTKEKAFVSQGPVVGYLPLSNYKGYEKGFELGYFLSIVSPEISKKLSHHIGVTFEQIYYTNNLGKRSVAGCVKLPVATRYEFYSGEFTPFLGVGASFQLMGISSGIFNLYTGMSIYKRFDISIKFESYYLFKPFIGAFAFNLGYRFGGY